jgi:hypothetical protein
MHSELEHERAVARLLRELPDNAVRPYDWQEFRRRARPRPALTVHLAGGRMLAAATVIALAVGAAAIRIGETRRPPPPTPAAPVTAEHAAAAQPPGEWAAERDETEAERWLASLPREPAFVRVGTRAAVETLEDHIAQVDDLLSAGRAGHAAPARLRVLQQERTQLLGSLVQVRYAETLADASR